MKMCNVYVKLLHKYQVDWIKIVLLLIIFVLQLFLYLILSYEDDEDFQTYKNFIIFNEQKYNFVLSFYRFHLFKQKDSSRTKKC